MCLTKHPLLTFMIMLAAALVFGTASYNLFFLFRANIELVVDYGAMALRDGALAQLFLLMLNGVVSLCAYLVLKACEKYLVEKLIGD